MSENIIFPDELVWLEEAERRGAFVRSEWRRENLRRSLAGKRGDRETERWIRGYGGDGWEFWRDVWVNVDGTSQIDLLAYREGVLWVIEAKNYVGEFVYADKKWVLNGEAFTTDHMSRMVERMNRVRAMVDRYGRGRCEIRGVMVFIGEHNRSVRVEGVDEFPFDVVVRREFRAYIEGVMCQASHYPALLGEEVGEMIRRVETAWRFPFKGLTEYEAASLKAGVHCGGCGRFDIEFSRKRIRCKACGCKEMKQNAMVRTAKELGLLYFGEEKVITRENLMRFSDYQFSVGLIKNNLGKHLRMIGGSRNVYYENPSFRK